jgi:hypothetical protein
MAANTVASGEYLLVRSAVALIDLKIAFHLLNTKWCQHSQNTSRLVLTDGLNYHVTRYDKFGIRHWHRAAATRGVRFTQIHSYAFETINFTFGIA